MMRNYGLRTPLISLAAHIAYNAVVGGFIAMARGGEGCFEASDIGAVLSFALGQLGGERAHHAALRGRRFTCRPGRLARRALLIGA